jgi:hypothetical protein
MTGPGTQWCSPRHDRAGYTVVLATSSSWYDRAGYTVVLATSSSWDDRAGYTVVDPVVSTSTRCVFWCALDWRQSANEKANGSGRAGKWTSGQLLPCTAPRPRRPRSGPAPDVARHVTGCRVPQQTRVLMRVGGATGKGPGELYSFRVTEHLAVGKVDKATDVCARSLSDIHLWWSAEIWKQSHNALLNAKQKRSEPSNHVTCTAARQQLKYAVG